MSLGKITEIKEIQDSDDNEDGYVIITDKGYSLSLLIDNYQNCCESWGYATTEDNLNDFIGSEVIGYTVFDENKAVAANKVFDTEIFKTDGYDAGSILFLNIHTNKGDLQFSVYNCHNGYYSHTGTVKIMNQGTVEHEEGHSL